MMLLELTTPDDFADDEAMRRAALRLAPITPYTADQIYGWLRAVWSARQSEAIGLEQQIARIAELSAAPPPEPDYRRGLRRPWWER